MAMNKFMHPKNMYKIPPDFTALALDYPEFKNISKIVGFFHTIHNFIY